MTFQKRLIWFFIALCFFFFHTSLIFSQQTIAVWKIDLEKKILPNGLTIIYQKDDSSPITDIQILIKGGKSAELLTKAGLAHLTTRLMLEIPDRTKLHKLMNQATKISITTKNDFSLINIASFSENLEDSLETITKIMLNPLLSGMRINGIKRLMNNQRKAEEDDTIKLAHNTIMANFFKGTSYANSVLGSEESLKKIKKREIENFYNSFFRSGNIIVSVSSDLEKEVFLKSSKKYLERFPPGTSPEIEPFLISAPEKKKIFIERDIEQSLVSIAFPLPKITKRNFIFACLLQDLLGKGIYSRLWPLRFKEKLAYNINASSWQWKGGGILEAYLETDTEKADIAMMALKKVIHNLYDNGITEEEFQMTKNHTKSFFFRHNETKEKRIYTIGFFEVSGLGFNFFKEFPSEIDKVSLPDFNPYIKNILNPEMGLEVVIGLKKE